jgi:hypothetical protein
MANNVTPLVQQCCLCGGSTTLWITGSAFINVKGKEYRVHYHNSCLNEEGKKIVTKMLQELAAKDMG